jgi:hypothetical protein
MSRLEAKELERLDALKKWGNLGEPGGLGALRMRQLKVGYVSCFVSYITIGFGGYICIYIMLYIYIYAILYIYIYISYYI